MADIENMLELDCWTEETALAIRDVCVAADRMERSNGDVGCLCDLNVAVKRLRQALAKDEE